MEVVLEEDVDDVALDIVTIAEEIRSRVYVAMNWIAHVCIKMLDLNFAKLEKRISYVF